MFGAMEGTTVWGGLIRACAWVGGAAGFEARRGRTSFEGGDASASRFGELRFGAWVFDDCDGDEE